MKHLILIFALILSATFVSKATNFTLVIATTDTAYAHWYLAYGVVDSDQVHIANLGARPVPPLYDSTDANHTAWIASVKTYDSSSTSLQSLLAIHSTTSDSCKNVLLATVGYKVAFANVPVNQWIMVQGNNFSTAWIGWTFPNNLTVINVRPVSAFPGR